MQISGKCGLQMDAKGLFATFSTMKSEISTTESERILRLTAMWALTEVSLGGLMHALRIPFSGLFVGGIALLCLFLITRYSSSKQVLVQALLTVVAIKAIASPHASPFAYLAMTVQFLCCLPLTGRIGRSTFGILVLLGVAFMYSPIQKLLLIWFTVGSDGVGAISEAIRLASASILPESIGIGVPIFVYLGIHILFASALILLAIRWKDGLPIDRELLAEWTISRMNIQHDVTNRTRNSTVYVAGFVFIIVVGLVLLLLPQWFPAWTSYLLRPLFILAIWIGIIRPAIVYVMNRKYNKRSFAAELKPFIDLFPTLREMIAFSWAKSLDGFKPARFFRWATFMFTLILMIESNSNG